MQTLTIMGEVVIEEFYHMTIMDENANQMELTHLSKKPPNLRSLLYIYFYFKIFTTFLYVHTREKD